MGYFESVGFETRTSAHDARVVPASNSNSVACLELYGTHRHQSGIQGGRATPYAPSPRPGFEAGAYATLRQALWIVSFLVLTLNAIAADLRLSISNPDAQRRPALVLSGLSSGQYGIQASTNFSNWFNLISSPGVGGELRFTHNEAGNFGTLYYRGIQLPDSPGPLAKIVPNVDSNYVAVGVITLVEGGRLSLTNEGGVIYTFTVAPSNVLQTAAITMQLVTNLVSFPFENELRTGVKFGPDGFRFHGAGLLEVRFPTNIPHLKVSSFAFDGEGGDFHLAPDRVTTNTVKIPVNHFSVFGTAVWAPTERTKAYETRVSNAESALQHRVAEILGTERQKQLLGQDNRDNEALAEVLKLQQDYYDRELEPQFEAAQKDCSLFRSLTPKVLGIERQKQLLGAGEGAGEFFIATAGGQKAICNCLEELVFACEEANISAESFMQGLLGIERQGALLGLKSSEDCGTGSLAEWISDAQNKKLPCLTKWIGTITYSEAGRFSKQTTTSGTQSGTQSQDFVSTVQETMSIQYSFEGGVERVELEDDSIPGLFSSLTWDLFFYPDASGAYSYKRDERKSFVCKSEDGVKQEDTLNSVNGAGTGSNEVRVHFVFEEGELTAFTILQRESFKLKIPLTNTRTRTDCPRRDRNTGELREQTPRIIFNNVAETSHSFAVNYIPTEQVVFSKVTTDELQGTVTGKRLELLLFGTEMVEIPYKWTFSLKRRPE